MFRFFSELRVEKLALAGRAATSARPRRAPLRPADKRSRLKKERERGAMPFRSFIGPGAFGPEALAAMSEAFEAAFKALQDTGRPNVVPEAIAGRIIAAAKLGERDPVRLREAALRKPD